MTTAAAIEQKKDLDQFRYTCTGSLEVDGDVITCPYAHGENMDIKQCLATSCNGAYATLAMELGGQDPGRVHGAGGPAGFPWQSATSIPKEALWPRRMGSAFFWAGRVWGQDKDLVNPAICWPLWGALPMTAWRWCPNWWSGETITGTSIPAAFPDGKDTYSIYGEETCRQLKEMMRNNVASQYGQASSGTWRSAPSPARRKWAGDRSPTPGLPALSTTRASLGLPGSGGKRRRRRPGGGFHRGPGFGPGNCG